ncbi:MAG: DUF4834 family protein [Chitinophagales bacterium]
MALLKFILVVYLIYISLKFVFVRVVPMLLVRKIQKLQEEAINRQQNAQQAYRQGATQSQGYQKPQQKGNVTITVDPQKHSSNAQFDDGEYIDYEEIK